MNLKDKTVVITGSTGGIGASLVEELKSEGVSFIFVSDNSEKLKKQSELLSPKAKYYVCDFKDQEETERISKRIAEENSDILLLINLAGIGIYKPLLDISLEDWNNSFNIGLTSTFLFTKNLFNRIDQSNGLVLTVGSGAGVIPMAGRSLYCATKFGLRGLVLSLSEEYKRAGSPRFTLITLGSTLTEFGPLSLADKKEEMDKGKAYFTPEWVAKKLVEIIKDEGREDEYTLYPGEYGFGEWEKPETK